MRCGIGDIAIQIGLVEFAADNGKVCVVFGAAEDWPDCDWKIVEPNGGEFEISDKNLIPIRGNPDETVDYDTEVKA